MIDVGRHRFGPKVNKSVSNGYERGGVLERLYTPIELLSLGEHEK